MHETVKGILSNFISIIENIGFVANRGRIYYLGNSDHSMLISMVYEYYEATEDVKFVQDSLATLEKAEFLIIKYDTLATFP